MTHFPLKIKYINSDEIITVTTPDDIRKNVLFIVQDSTVWGRKPHLKKTTMYELSKRSDSKT
jgi:hypothetical protein